MKRPSFLIILIALLLCAVLVFVLRPMVSQVGRVAGSTMLVTSSTSDTEAVSVNDTVEIIDPFKLYRVRLPKDWAVNMEGVVDGKKYWPSVIRAQSSDWNFTMQDTIDATGHISGGAATEFYVFNQNIGHAPTGIHMSIAFESSEAIAVSGIQGKLDTYRESNDLKECLELDAVIISGGHYFTFRYSYNPKTIPDGKQRFMDMLETVQLL